MVRDSVKYLFLFCLLIGVIKSFAQQTVSGKITDGITKEPLSGATIIIKNLTITSTSDAKGNYIFNDVPEGQYEIKVSFVSYHDTSALVSVKTTSVKQDFQMSRGLVEMASVIITATRTEKPMKDIPSSVGIITQDQLENLPAITADEYLSAISGMNVTRHFGIFYQSGDVYMRGLNRNVYTLLLIDGVPLSILDGGATNWNRIKPKDIERIEVIKGPNSSLYGSNAMGGVVNIITKQPSTPFKGDVGIFYGTYSTTGGSINLSANKIKNDKGFYCNFNGFMRLSDGYIIMPDSLKDSTDVKTYSKEYNASILAGYSFKKDNSIELDYNFSDETKGLGKKIYEPDGNYDYTLDHFLQVKYRATFGKVKVSATAFFKLEDYNNQRESIKSSGAYVLYNTTTTSGDGGIWCNASFPLLKKQNITVGFDSKSGVSNSSDVYRTSTDTVNNKGNMNYYGLFVQDDFPIIKNKIKAIVGLRYDYVAFYNGDLSINDPSATTSFMIPYLTSYSDKNWQALSPKGGILFNISNNLSSYISFSRGFRTSTLGDLVLTSSVNKGFKIANPELRPEYLSNAEIGINWNYEKKLTVVPVIFYSIGRDFQYFVGTGDSIYTTKTNPQPIIRRQNIGKVEFYGAELYINYIFNKHLTLFGNYSYNHSVIKSFDVEGYVAEDLTGKIITNVPLHQVYSGFIFKNKYINAGFTYKYKSSEWADDQNTFKIAGYSLFDAKISHKFIDKLDVSVTVQNIFNKITLDSKYLKSPGRFIIAELEVMF